jgi:hypothetical protein
LSACSLINLTTATTFFSTLLLSFCKSITFLLAFSTMTVSVFSVATGLKGVLLSGSSDGSALSLRRLNAEKQ